MKPILFLLIAIPPFCYSQTQVAVSKVTKLPDSIKVKGKVVDAVQWTDSLGMNLVVTMQDEYKSKIEGLLSQELWADHYVLKKDSSMRLWHVYDFSLDCGTDAKARFLRNTFSVTDLDKNGKAEVWLVYHVGCRGDVGPMEMKVIMYEGKTIYAMRGHNKVRIDQARFMGGDYKYNYNFLHGPKPFKEFARKLWNANVERAWWEPD